MHYVDKKPEEIDFIGARFPNSIEKAMRSDGSFDNSQIFKDDRQIIGFIDNSKMIILLGEATMSIYPSEIRERANKLNNLIRVKYTLQRFGIIDNEEIARIVAGTSDTIRLLKIIFLLAEKLIPTQVGDIKFLTYKQITSFIQDRANNILKIKGKALLPSGLQDVVTFLQSTNLER